MRAASWRGKQIGRACIAGGQGGDGDLSDWDLCHGDLSHGVLGDGDLCDGNFCAGDRRCMTKFEIKSGCGIASLQEI